MRIVGVVVHGDSFGRTLGYPTANVVPQKEVHIADGVYAAQAFFRGTCFGAACVVSFGGKKIEGYLFDYAGPDFYGEELALDIFEKVSEHDSITSEVLLKEKIAEDLRQIKKILYEQGN